MRKISIHALLLTAALVLFAGCSNEKTNSPENTSGSSNPPAASPAPSDSSGNADKKDGAAQAITDPHSIAVMVNKQFSLPENYEPTDLVDPNVRFTFKEKIEKRKMRKEAAEALEKMFAGAEKDGVYLAGVSAYRSHKTQTAVFNRYVKKDGEEKAKTYSAVPGHSEHETGLAIDVSGSDGKCAATDCFAGTKEAEWLAKHAPEYGFIIRYPEGKEAITGYKYEPWHIRYVGIDIAKNIAERNITLEEYFNAVPVSK
ncbi:M15 family metallopeptidase [Aneurinibacillus aneurinilyticus]|jgi:D-alanyl-D-alanine carboxypeptidase|uniref:Serine-type D-Ala-D-Ala carboxypeptidase n=1 Tax=Aneurinibacillus aneurinilyticus ATCC 12856 TaxID=649747 RepID=U1XYU9_ANEAE|nr:M15 family metallopeptidase [Aneurinibacillus aneurinilyticus]ERI05172.1 serine-type D-Ala-D-Ala carboxypeptidase [Aneurinibacillus aneurinilyticus ATCC 12856]MCI1694141.1 M15 family metallopeptidase [Aneurinibacillus aneurinilyticus]MED0708165.1 M15 family metallopeptidase [Aneurinibacillus aneurinilyticus]MED0721482.1 M15 family metallopeptidase [Aneurinibacillus aneurinilyticus]MED0734050.1 M15 family metallopeptidase [Aneurinibacillus aneurinilyticus]